MRHGVVTTFLVMVTFLAAVHGAYAEDRQWPTKLNIGGFEITDVKGIVRADGSGSATGALSLGSIGSQKISLSRSSRGDITGSLALNGNAGGVGIQANLALTGRGLDGKGTILSSPKPISDAAISIAPGGRVSGSGRVVFGGISIPAAFSLSGSLDVNGSAAVQKQVDTPLALYTFNGNLNLKANSGKVQLFANGKVRRTGKLANQISSQDVSGVQVNMSDGQATVNVGGVDVVFKFF